MQYAILINMDERSWDRLPKAERERVKTETDVLIEDLVSKGQLKSAAVLQGGFTARTLKMSHGELRVTDGPFAETKEVLAGFQLVECANIEEAMEIAKRFPGVRLGFTLEVRPVGDNCAMLRTSSAEPR